MSGFAAWAIRTIRKRFVPHPNYAVNRSLNLAELLIIFRNSKSTDARDQVYGLLNLSDGNTLITPDYSTSNDTLAVYIETTRRVFEATDNLDILSALDY